MSFPPLVGLVESLLFINGEALSFKRLAAVLTMEEAEVRTAVHALAAKYTQDREGGLMLILTDDEAQLVTKPAHASWVEALAKGALQERLSKASLEVLSIIAYRAPIARADIEAIRGVNSSFILRNLLLRGLIEREGNPSDGRGFLYVPTFRFLQSIGVQRIEALPEYAALAQDARVQGITPDAELLASKNH